MDNNDELRALRLWHWQQSQVCRRKQEKFEQADNPSRFTRQSARIQKHRANMHIKAVQALNDVVSGTAEQDDKNAYRR